MNVPLWAWFAVLGVILVMLAVDLFAHRDAHVIKVKEAAIWSALWVALGVGFGAVIWWWAGSEFAAQYYAGYLIEKSLAIDSVGAIVNLVRRAVAPPSGLYCDTPSSLTHLKLRLTP